MGIIAKRSSTARSVLDVASWLPLDEEVGDPEGGDAVEDSGCFTLLDRAEGEQVARVDDGVDLLRGDEFLGQRVLVAAVHVRDEEQPQRDGGVSGSGR